MATSADDSSIVHLKTKDFPPEFENDFCPRYQSPKQNAAAEKVIVAGADRRQRIMMVDSPAPMFLYDGGSGFPFVGLLRMEFNGTHFMGTATMIANGSCLLTCAHNVVDYDETTKKFVDPASVWFELRKNEPGSGSILIKQYKVTKVAVYPRYFEYPSSESGYDLALCWIDVPEEDNTVKELYSKYDGDTPTPLCGLYISSKAAVVGFPSEHHGEKWGMVADIPKNNAKDWKLGLQPFRAEPMILTYDFIDTSPGQSGSPVMGMKPGDILGVHTGGKASLKKNWATHITPTKLEWIAETLGHPWNVYDDYRTLSLSS